MLLALLPHGITSPRYVMIGQAHPWLPCLNCTPLSFLAPDISTWKIELEPTVTDPLPGFPFALYTGILDQVAQTQVQCQKRSLPIVVLVAVTLQVLGQALSVTCQELGGSPP